MGHWGKQSRGDTMNGGLLQRYIEFIFLHNMAGAFSGVWRACACPGLCNVSIRKIGIDHSASLIQGQVSSSLQLQVNTWPWISYRCAIMVHRKVSLHKRTSCFPPSTHRTQHILTSNLSIGVLWIARLKCHV